ncbi:MAG: hypothetical protein AAF533_15885 [Acidobacteriota bacterium]
MFDELLIASVGVFSVSLLISMLAGRQTLGGTARGYLFSGNNPWLATSSNVGSMLSIAVVFTLYVVLVSGYGLRFVLAVAVGLTLGHAFLYWRLNKLASAPDRDMDAYRGSTILALARERGVNATLPILFQYILPIVLEYTVLLACIRGVLGETSSGFLSSGFLVAALVAFLCATYTSTGGFRGILRTDLFQGGVFVAAFLFLVSTNWTEVSGVLAPSNLGRHDEPVPVLAWLTVVLFTGAAYSAYPDIFVRNFSSLSLQKGVKLWWLPLSFTLMLVALVPLTLLGLFMVESEGIPLVFDPKATLDFFIREFRDWASSPDYSLGVWLVVSGFLCMFITTIDTWLVGLMQHFRGNRRVAELRLLPYLVSGACLMVALCLHSKHVLLVGLITFPFLFYDCLLLVLVTTTAEAAQRWARFAKVGLGAGLLAYAGSCWFFRADLEANAYLVILYCAIAVALGVLIPFLFVTVSKRLKNE